MNMRNVNSSNIARVGYDYAAQTLRVEFVGSGIYDFTGVPPEIDAGIRQVQDDGGSVGRFFHYAVKGKFPSAKIDAEELAGAA